MARLFGAYILTTLLVCKSLFRVFFPYAAIKVQLREAREKKKLNLILERRPDSSFFLLIK